ncbi:MAG: DUF3253 domain-containing protein [Archangium sp.]
MTRLERKIVELLRERGAGKTICPSDVARSLEEDEAAWRALMEPVREAGRQLAAQGVLVVTQRGRVVDAATARGAIRYRLP